MVPIITREIFDTKGEAQVFEGIRVLGNGESHDLRNSHFDDC
jgi:hypothetical protein